MGACARGPRNDNPFAKHCTRALLDAGTCSHSASRMAQKTDAMAALRIAKKELRSQIRQLLSSLSNDSIIEQCW